MYVTSRSFRGLAGGTVSSEAKSSLSVQMRDLNAGYNPPFEALRKLGHDIAYASAHRILREMAQYGEWEDSGLFSTLASGGWYSSQKIRELGNAIIAKATPNLTPEHRASTESIAKEMPVFEKLPATCADEALDFFGTVFGRSEAAKWVMCNKTKAKMAAGLILVLLVMAAFGPYANLLSKMLKGRK